MSSSKLPGEVLIPLVGEWALDHVIDRVKAVQEVERGQDVHPEWMTHNSSISKKKLSP